ncbi:MAG: hypothetical protein JO138_06235 [Acidobacteriaceae bacterium]|nr:hypothetical protein [Acidobacteriaceae bacterium]
MPSWIASGWIAWLTLGALPLLLMIRRFKPAGKAPATHRIVAEQLAMKFNGAK